MKRNSDGKWSFQKKPRVIRSFEMDEPEEKETPRYRLLKKHKQKQESKAEEKPRFFLFHMGTVTQEPDQEQDEDQEPESEVDEEELSGVEMRARGQLLRLEKIRHKRRLRRWRSIGVCVLICLAIVAYFTGVFGASAALLADTLDTVNMMIRPGAGYPIPVTESGFVQAGAIAGGYVVLNQHDVKVYSSGGNEFYTVQHNYSNPAMALAGSRFCVYARGGNSLTVYSRSRVLFENKYQDAILHCAMSQNGMLGVFHESGLTIYDPMFEIVFEWRTTEVPTAMVFADDNRQFAVASPHVYAGALGGKVFLYTTDTNAPDAATAVIESTDGVPIGLKYLTRKTILVIYNTYCAVYNTVDGTELARYNYQAQSLQSWQTTPDNSSVVLLFGDGEHSSMTKLCVVDTAMNEKASCAVHRIATQMVVTRSQIHVVTSNSVLTYGLNTTLAAEQKTESYVRTLIDAGKLFLMTQQEISVFTPPANET